MFWGLRSSLDLRLRITIACSRLNSLGKMRVDLVRSHLDQIQIKSKFELWLQNTSHHPREPVLVPIFSRPLFPPRQVSRSVQSLNWSSPQREGRPKGPLTARWCWVKFGMNMRKIRRSNSYIQIHIYIYRIIYILSYNEISMVEYKKWFMGIKYARTLLRRHETDLQSNEFGTW